MSHRSSTNDLLEVREYKKSYMEEEKSPPSDDEFERKIAKAEAAALQEEIAKLTKDMQKFV